MLQWRPKVPCAATNTQCSRNKYIHLKRKEKKKQPMRGGENPEWLRLWKMRKLYEDSDVTGWSKCCSDWVWWDEKSPLDLATALMSIVSVEGWWWKPERSGLQREQEKKIWMETVRLQFFWGILLQRETEKWGKWVRSRFLKAWKMTALLYVWRCTNRVKCMI